MDKENTVTEVRPTNDLQCQLTAANQEIQSLTQQLNCLVLLAKKAWHGDQTATTHLARVIGVNPENEQNTFMEKRTNPRSAGKKTVKIAGNADEISPKKTPSISSSSSQENLHEQQDLPSNQSASKNTYLQPFLKQSHIDPIRGQNSKKIFNNMIRHHQNELRRPPTAANRNTSTTVRPRATKHLYRPASAEHVVRHLGTPISRHSPFFVFAGREFFQQTSNYSPLYQRALVTSAGARQSRQPDFYDQSEVLGSAAVTEPAPASTQTDKYVQQSSVLRFGTRSILSDTPGRSSSVLSNASSSKLSERDRRDAMRLQRQLNLPRQGWINQQA